MNLFITQYLQNGPDLWIAGAVVAVFAWDRFNTPRTNRSLTTAIKYHLAATWYVIVMLAVFLTLMRSPEILLPLLSERARELVGLGLPELSAPLIAALLLTALLPLIPFLGTLDQRVRTWFQRMAAIPAEVRNRSRALQKWRFQVPADEQRKIRDELVKDKEIEPQDIVFDPSLCSRSEAHEVRYLWTKASALVHALRTDTRLADFVELHSKECRRIKEEHARLKSEARILFKLESEDVADATPFSATIATARAAFRSSCRRFLEGGEWEGVYVEGVYDFITRALLRCFSRENLRERFLESLGFQVVEGPRSGSPWIVFDLITRLFLTLSGVLALVYFMRTSTPTGQDVGVVLLISVNLCIATLCALVPKRWWSFARRSEERGRPWLCYLLSAIAAAILTSPTRFLFQLWFTGGDLDKTYSAFLDKSAWALVPAVAALVLAFELDDRRSDLRVLGKRFADANGWQLRCAEALVQASILAGTALLVVGLLPEASRNGLQVVGTCAANGLVLGLIVPAWWRSTLLRRSAESSSPLGSGPVQAAPVES